MLKILLTALAMAGALGLSACATGGSASSALAGAQLAVQIAHGTYCTAVSEAGKQALRALVTGGVQVIACPEGTHTVNAVLMTPASPPTPAPAEAPH